jgi:hypothetical protein
MVSEVEKHGPNAGFQGFVGELVDEIPASLWREEEHLRGTIILIMQAEQRLGAASASSQLVKLKYWMSTLPERILTVAKTCQRPSTCTTVGSLMETKGSAAAIPGPGPMSGGEAFQVNVPVCSESASVARPAKPEELVPKRGRTAWGLAYCSFYAQRHF